MTIENSVAKETSTDKEKTKENFVQLVTPALSMLYRQAMKYTNNPEDAEDLVQEAIERAYRAFASFQTGTNIEAWLTTILKNCYFNYYQKNKRRPQRANSDSGEYNDWDIYSSAIRQGNSPLSPEEEYVGSEINRDIFLALDKLPPERRQIFIDAVIDGKPYKQIAREQGIKIGTVMSRLNRARAQLKKELAQYLKDESSSNEEGNKY